MRNGELVNAGRLAVRQRSPGGVLPPAAAQSKTTTYVLRVRRRTSPQLAAGGTKPTWC
jgi:hypothetical protein